MRVEQEVEMNAWSKDGLDRLDELVTRHVGADGVPGAAWLTARDGEVHVGFAGTLDGSVPVQRDSIFRIASRTKPVTAAAVLALAEDCVLRLDDPLDRWLPELADRSVMVDPNGSVDDTVAAARQPTVHDALTFRLSWGMDFADWEGQTLPGAIAAAMGLEVGPPQPSKTPPPDEFVAVLGQFPLDRQPGEKWLYNMGSDVLGVVVERPAGKRFGDFLEERIFGPLGMRDTAFHVPAASMDRFGPSYLPSAGRRDRVRCSTPPTAPGRRGPPSSSALAGSSRPSTTASRSRRRCSTAGARSCRAPRWQR